jgi:hypothetical protein
MLLGNSSTTEMAAPRIEVKLCTIGVPLALPGQPQSDTKGYYTERGIITIDRICVA